MRKSKYQDADGRWYAVWIPDGVDEEEAVRGIVIGPPPMDGDWLPEATAIRLHNELFVRGILTAKDVRRNRQDVFAALMSALRVDTERIANAYLEYERGD